MPSMMRILAIILHCQVNRRMSFALHQEGHRFGPPSAHIFMFVIFSVVRFSLALCVSTLTQASNEKKNIGILRVTGEVTDRFNEITLFGMVLFWQKAIEFFTKLL